MTSLDWALAGKVVWTLFLLAWLVIRWIPNRRARKVAVDHTTRTPSERFSMIVSWLGLGGLPLVWVLTGIPAALDHATSGLLVIVGTLIAIGSLLLFRRTHKDLGRMWSHSLDLRADHTLVTHGIYRRVRHPMYSAFFLWALAQPFLLANWFAGFSGLVGFGTLYLLRIGQEEAMMEQRFGQEWRDYAARTSRLIPGLY